MNKDRTPTPLEVPWPDAPGWLPLTEATVQRITRIEDPAMRNLWITQSYADLGRRLLAVLGTDQSWCTFAIWASATAGASIREDELPHRAATVIDAAAEHIDRIVEIGRLGRSSVERLVHEALRQVAGSIAHGNTLVYAELAPLFVRLVECLERQRFTWSCDPQAILATIGVPSRDEDPLVNLAFDSYLAAAVASSRRTRAQHVLAANVAAVLHEQRRLQNDLATALGAGIVDIGTALSRTGGRALPACIDHWLLGITQRRVAPHVDALWDHVATHLLMTLSLPDETLRLGCDVPPPADGGSLFPLALREYAQPELSELMATWDLTGGTARGSGADDWSDLRQRMNFIVNLFRSRQQHLGLTRPPFSQPQLDAMVAGQLPPI